MSTEADIVERLAEIEDVFSELDGKTICIAAEGNTFVDDGVFVADDHMPILAAAKAEITKLRAERDAAARDMRERCGIEAFRAVTAVCITDDGNTVLADHVASAIRALPDTPALLATDGKDVT